MRKFLIHDRYIDSLYAYLLPKMVPFNEVDFDHFVFFYRDESSLFSKEFHRFVLIESIEAYKKIPKQKVLCVQLDNFKIQVHATDEKRGAKDEKPNTEFIKNKTRDVRELAEKRIVKVPLDSKDIPYAVPSTSYDEEAGYFTELQDPFNHGQLSVPCGTPCEDKDAYWRKLQVDDRAKLLSQIPAVTLKQLSFDLPVSPTLEGDFSVAAAGDNSDVSESDTENDADTDTETDSPMGTPDPALWVTPGLRTALPAAAPRSASPVWATPNLQFPQAVDVKVESKAVQARIAEDFGDAFVATLEYEFLLRGFITSLEELLQKNKYRVMVPDSVFNTDYIPDKEDLFDAIRRLASVFNKYEICAAFHYMMLYLDRCSRSADALLPKEYLHEDNLYALIATSFFVASKKWRDLEPKKWPHLLQSIQYFSTYAAVSTEDLTRWDGHLLFGVSFDLYMSQAQFIHYENYLYAVGVGVLSPPSLPFVYVDEEINQRFDEAFAVTNLVTPVVAIVNSYGIFAPHLPKASGFVPRKFPLKVEGAAVAKDKKDYASDDDGEFIQSFSLRRLTGPQ